MKKAKDYTGFLGDCNDDQLKALEQFRQIITDMGLQNPPYDDHFLLRFLRARKFDIPKTELMFKNYIQWRKDNDVDNIQEYLYTELPQTRVFYPHGYHKTDKLGRPIYIERIGKLQLQQLFQVTQEERLIRYYIQSYETLQNRIFPACSLAKGERVDQTFSILDLKGCTMKMASKQVYNFIQIASKIAQDNYPEMLGKMFIVNAPMLFSGIWSMIKIWLDERTRNKITIIGSGYQKEILKYVDPENLPEFLGGTSKVEGEEDVLALNIGPWNTDGTDPLFPCEPGNSYHYNKDQAQQVNTNQEGLTQNSEEVKQVEQQEEKKEALQQEEQKEEDEEQEQEKLDELKNALAQMQVGQPSQKPPTNPDKHEMTTQNNHIVSDTPLNTEVEGENQEG